MALLRLEDVTKVFRTGLFGGQEIRAVEDVTMEVKEGEIVSLVGESGSGKTTIARMILRFYRPTKGRIYYKGRDVWRLRGDEVKWYYSEVQGIFQDPYSSFNPIHRVERILYKTLHHFHPSLGGRGVEERIREAIERVGLHPGDVLGKYPHQLSGGQLQRLSIARALLVEPSLIIADEPVSMLDASTRIDVLNIFADLRDKEGLSVLMIGHDILLANYVSDRVVVLYKGNIVEEGPAKPVFVNPLHPYTGMLLESIPRLDKKWEKRLEEKAEEEEYTAYRLKGCRFAPRCPAARKICFEAKPPTLKLEERSVACWIYSDYGEKS